MTYSGVCGEDSSFTSVARGVRRVVTQYYECKKAQQHHLGGPKPQELHLGRSLSFKYHTKTDFQYKNVISLIL